MLRVLVVDDQTSSPVTPTMTKTVQFICQVCGKANVTKPLPDQTTMKVYEDNGSCLHRPAFYRLPCPACGEISVVMQDEKQ